MCAMYLHKPTNKYIFICIFMCVCYLSCVNACLLFPFRSSSPTYFFSFYVFVLLHSIQIGFITSAYKWFIKSDSRFRMMLKFNNIYAMKWCFLSMHSNISARRSIIIFSLSSSLELIVSSVSYITHNERLCSKNIWWPSSCINHAFKHFQFQ